MTPQSRKANSSRLHWSLKLMMFFVSMTVFVGCSEPASNLPIAESRPPFVSEKFPNQEVLLEGEMETYTAFADINNDGKPDLILGTNGSGHAFDHKTRKVSYGKTGFVLGEDVSIHLNESTSEVVKFKKPYWPKSGRKDGVIPDG